MCVCERERDRQTDRQRQRERGFNDLIISIIKKKNSDNNLIKVNSTMHQIKLDAWMD